MNKVTKQDILDRLGVIDDRRVWKDNRIDFEELTQEDMEIIGEILGDEFLDGTHNEAPSPREFLELMSYNEENIFGGYVVDEDEDLDVFVNSVWTPDEYEVLKSMASYHEEIENGFHYWWD